MLCSHCGIGQVPAAGRAADNGLCCKCDRLLNGHQSLQEKAPKVIRRIQGRYQVDAETAQLLLALDEEDAEEDT